MKYQMWKGFGFFSTKSFKKLIRDVLATENFDEVMKGGDEIIGNKATVHVVTSMPYMCR